MLTAVSTVSPETPALANMAVEAAGVDIAALRLAAAEALCSALVTISVASSFTLADMTVRLLPAGAEAPKPAAAERTFRMADLRASLKSVTSPLAEKATRTLSGGGGGA